MQGFDTGTQLISLQRRTAVSNIVKMQTDSFHPRNSCLPNMYVALWDITLLSRNKIAFFKSEYKVEVIIEIREICLTSLLFTYSIWFSEHFDE